MVSKQITQKETGKRNRRKAGVWGGAENRIDRTVMQKSGIPRRIDESQQCDTYIPFRTTWFKAKQHHSNVGRNVPSETRSTALHTLAGATSTRQGLRYTALSLNIWPNCLPLPTQNGNRRLRALEQAYPGIFSRFLEETRS